jgi:hypothetical protein
MAEYEEGIVRVLAESRTQPQIEGLGAFPAFSGIINRQRAHGLVLDYMVRVTGGDPALPQKVAFAVDRISALLESPEQEPIEVDLDLGIRQLVERIRLGRDAIRQCADQLGLMAATDEALALAAVPTDDANGIKLWAACNAALDAHDAALVVLARYCDEHPSTFDLCVSRSGSLRTRRRRRPTTS